MSNLTSVRNEMVFWVNDTQAVIDAGVTAVGEWMPHRRAEDINGLEIIVAVSEVEQPIKESRGPTLHNRHIVSVAVFQPLGDPGSESTIAEGIQLIIEGIRNHIIGQRLSAGTVVLQTRQPVVMDVTAWRENRIARSLLEITVQTHLHLLDGDIL